MRLATVLLLLAAPAVSAAEEGTFEELAIRDVSAGGEIRGWQGGRTLKGAAFYEALERPDLAASYRRNQIARWSLLVGGGAATAAGVALRVATHEEGCIYPYPNLGRSAHRDLRLCVKENQPSMALPYSLIAGGMLAVIAGLAFDPHPVNEVAAARLAEEHNRRLRLRTRAHALADLRVGVGTDGSFAVAGRF